MANKFVLTGGGTEVHYTIGGNPSFTALTFKQGAVHKSFTPQQVKTEATGLGTLVSVPLVQTVDTGGSRFGFFLPAVQVPLGQSAVVSTCGVTESFGGPNSVPHHPSTWQCVHLQGTAQAVLVPLEAPAPVPA